MNTTVIAAENARTGANALAIRETRRGENLQREDRQSAGSRRALPSFLVAFDGDEVAISSGKDTAVKGVQEQYPVHVPSPASRQAIEAQKNKPEQALRVRVAGSAVESGPVSYAAGIGPYDARVSTVAMKRYGEASSYRNSSSSSFELTI